MHPFPSVAVSSSILGILGIVGKLSRVPKFAEYVPSMRPDDGVPPGVAFLRIFATGRCKFSVGRINQSVLRSLRPGYISIRRSPWRWVMVLWTERLDRSHADVGDSSQVDPDDLNLSNSSQVGPLRRRRGRFGSGCSWRWRRSSDQPSQSAGRCVPSRQRSRRPACGRCGPRVTGSCFDSPKSKESLRRIATGGAPVRGTGRTRNARCRRAHQGGLR